jgi:hypothetical protein
MEKKEKKNAWENHFLDVKKKEKEYFALLYDRRETQTSAITLRNESTMLAIL